MSYEIKNELINKIGKAKTIKSKLDLVVEFYRHSNVANIIDFINIPELSDVQKLYVLYCLFGLSQENTENRKKHQDLLELYKDLKNKYPEFNKNKLFKKNALDVNKVIDNLNNSKLNINLEKFIAEENRQVPEQVNTKQGNIIPDLQQKQTNSVANSIIENIKNLFNNDTVPDKIKNPRDKINVLINYFENNLEQLIYSEEFVNNVILTNEEMLYILYKFFNSKVKENRSSHKNIVEAYRRLKKRSNPKFIESKGGLKIELLEEHLFKNSVLSKDTVLDNIIHSINVKKEEENARKAKFVQDILDNLSSTLQNIDSNFNIQIISFATDLADFDEKTMTIGTEFLNKLNSILKTVNKDDAIGKYRYFFLKFLMEKLTEVEISSENILFVGNLLDIGLNSLSEDLYLYELKNNLTYEQMGGLLNSFLNNMFRKYSNGKDFASKNTFSPEGEIVDKINSLIRILDKASELRTTDKNIAESDYINIFLKSFKNVFDFFNSRNFSHNFDNKDILFAMDLFDQNIASDVMNIINKYKEYEGNLGQNFNEYIDKLFYILVFYNLFKNPNGEQYINIYDTLKIINLPFSFEDDINKNFFIKFSSFLRKLNVENINDISLLKLFKNDEFISSINSILNNKEVSNAFSKIFLRMMDNPIDRNLMRFIYIADKIVNDKDITTAFKKYLLIYVEQNINEENLLENMINNINNKSSHKPNREFRNLYFFLKNNRDDFVATKDDKYIKIDYIIKNDSILRKVDDFDSKLDGVKNKCIENNDPVIFFDEYKNAKNNFLSTENTSFNSVLRDLANSIVCGYDGYENNCNLKNTDIVNYKQSLLFLKEINDLSKDGVDTLYNNLYNDLMNTLNDPKLSSNFDYFFYDGSSLFLQSIIVCFENNDSYRKVVKNILEAPNFPILLEKTPIKFKEKIKNLLLEKNSLSIPLSCKSSIAARLINNVGENDDKFLNIFLNNFATDNYNVNSVALNSLLELNEKDLFDIMPSIVRNQKYFENFIKIFLNNEKCDDILFKDKFLYIIRALQPKQINFFVKELKANNFYSKLDDTQARIINENIFKNFNVGKDGFYIVNDLIKNGFSRNEDETMHLLELFSNGVNFIVYLSELDEDLLLSDGFSNFINIMDKVQSKKQLCYNTIFSRLNDIKSKTKNNSVKIAIDKLFIEHVNILPVNLQAKFVNKQKNPTKVYRYINLALDSYNKEKFYIILYQINKFNVNLADEKLYLKNILSKLAKNEDRVLFFKKIFLTRPFRFKNDIDLQITFLDNVPETRDKITIITDLMSSSSFRFGSNQYKTDFLDFIISQDEEILNSDIITKSMKILKSMKPKTEKVKFIENFIINKVLSNNVFEPLVIDYIADFVNDSNLNNDIVEKISLISKNPNSFNYFIEKIKRDKITTLLQNQNLLNSFVLNNSSISNENLLRPCFKGSFFRKPLFYKLSEIEKSNILRCFLTSGAINNKTRSLIKKEFCKDEQSSQEFNKLTEFNNRGIRVILNHNAQNVDMPSNQENDELKETVIKLYDKTITQDEAFNLIKLSKNPEDTKTLLDYSVKANIDWINDFYLSIARHSPIDEDSIKRIYDTVPNDYKLPLMINAVSNKNIHNPEMFFCFLTESIDNDNIKDDTLNDLLKDSMLKYDIKQQDTLKSGQELQKKLLDIGNELDDKLKVCSVTHTRCR